MELGLFQLQWMKELEEHSERQFKEALAKKTENGFLACCLGQGLITYCEMFNKTIPWIGRKLISGTSISYLTEDYEKLGLRDSGGRLNSSVMIDGKLYKSLAGMNDGRMTWPEIAKYIRENPDNIFTKSV